VRTPSCAICGGGFCSAMWLSFVASPAARFSRGIGWVDNLRRKVANASGQASEDTGGQDAICYYSRSGNTEKMAHLIQKGAMEEASRWTPRTSKSQDSDDSGNMSIIVAHRRTTAPSVPDQGSNRQERPVPRPSSRTRSAGAFSSSGQHRRWERDDRDGDTPEPSHPRHVICGRLLGRPHYAPSPLSYPTRGPRRPGIRYGKRVAKLTKKLHG